VSFYDEGGRLSAVVYVRPDGHIYAHAVEGSTILHRARCGPDQTSEADL
jgi:hypothetical protein